MRPTRVTSRSRSLLLLVVPALWLGHHLPEAFAVAQRRSKSLERKVHAMTMDVLTEMDEELEEPRRPRRKMKDFAAGELIEGVVTRDCNDSVHLDIGAAADGVLEKGDYVGAADPQQLYWPGKRLNVTVWSNAGHCISLRLHRYEGTRCGTCFQSLDEPLYGTGHHERCVQCWNIGRGVPPFFESGGKRYHCVVGAVPTKVKKKVQALIDKGNRYWDTWAEKSSRPQQKGRLHGVGLQLSRNNTFPGTEQLQDMCNDVLQEMLDSGMVQMLNNASNEDVWQSFRWYHPPKLPSAQPGVAVRDPMDGGAVQSYIGQGYMAVLNNCSQAHGPPLPVARLLGVKSCRDTCTICRSKGCQACDECCVHVDNDQSASVLLGIQEENPIVNEMAFFVMGSKAFPLAGGRAFLFDGKVVPHGVWCMRGQYQGMAFVKKVPYQRRLRRKS
mmetsp:Transcript_126565/g.300613  ORF Transcript_126565/g.300613 Transcript_126565/m.300613 type:complete len:442 (+) Transcript_126565:49-1374(+)